MRLASAAMEASVNTTLAMVAVSKGDCPGVLLM
jgi:hypothetical protein